MFDPSKEYFGECPFCGAEEVSIYGKGLSWKCGSWHNAGQDITESELCQTRVKLNRVLGQRDAWAGKRHAEWCCGPGESCCCGHEESLEGLPEEARKFELEDPDHIDRLERYIAKLELVIEFLLDGLDANYDPEVCGLSSEEWIERIKDAKEALYDMEPGETKQSLILQKALNWVRFGIPNMTPRQYEILRRALRRVKNGESLRHGAWERQNESDF